MKTEEEQLNMSIEEFIGRCESDNKFCLTVLELLDDCLIFRGTLEKDYFSTINFDVYLDDEEINFSNLNEEEIELVKYLEKENKNGLIYRRLSTSDAEANNKHSFNFVSYDELYFLFTNTRKNKKR